MFHRLLSGVHAFVLVSLASSAAQAQSFNCRGLNSPHEALICQNTQLSALDQRMADLYFRLRSSLVGSERGSLESSQKQWLQSRTNCKQDVRCIEEQYARRIGELSALADGPASRPSFDCATSTKPDEVVICQSSRLSALDQRMVSLYVNRLNSVAGVERQSVQRSQIQWLQSRMNCGRDTRCIEQYYERRIAELSSAALQQVPMASGVCHLVSAAKTPIVRVSVIAPAQQIRTGDPVEVQWQVGSNLDLGCRTPLYLVISTPVRTRFEGEKFLAVPPGAGGPYGIKYRPEHTRVFVPLHLGGEQLKGILKIKAYQAGPLSLEWALIEVPKRVADPKTKADFVFGQERISTSVRMSDDVVVVAGNPIITVRDQFTTDSPKTVIWSNSGEFALQVFETFYRVLDRKTGELLLERGGRDPNFSPSSRFLGAFADGPGFEVIDLYAGQVIASSATRGFINSVHLCAWSLGDTVMALSMWGWGAFETQQALVDGSQRSFPSTSCHACQGFDVPMLVDLEAGIVAYAGQESGWESLFTEAVGQASAEKRALEQLPYKENNDSDDWGKRNNLAQSLSNEQLATLGRAAFFDPTKILDPLSNNTAGWDLSGETKLSHHCVPDQTGNCKSNTGDDDEWRKHEAQLAAARVFHKGTPTILPALSTIGQSAETRLISSRGMTWRGALQTRDPATSVSEPQTVSLLERLGSLGLNLNSDQAINPAIKEISYEIALDRPREVIAPIIESIPSAAQRFPIRSTDNANLLEVAPDYDGLQSEASLVEPFWIRTLATWQIEGRVFWLIHCNYYTGASGDFHRNWLFLLHGTEKNDNSLIDLTHRLKFKVGSKPSGLNERGELEQSLETPSNMGFGGWPDSVEKVTIAYNRYLLSSGKWSKTGLGWILLFDLKTDQILYFNRSIPEVETASDFGVTSDGRIVVQANSNGQLYFHDVASGKITLRGNSVDDELIVYDQHGYYMSSPEGAQFIFLKFPGIPGYNSFRQFASTLDRPDLIVGVLSGKGDNNDPRLTPPPTLNITAEVTGTGSNRSARLQMNATSNMGLARLRVFVDGRIAGEYPLSGTTTNTVVSLPLEPEARWVTAIAVDTKGYESVPQGRELPQPDKAKASRLFVVAVGTNRYEDENNILQLTAARADAENFAKTMQGLQEPLYGQVHVVTFLDAVGLRTSLPAKLREIAKAATERDTIMLFAAGHGIRDPSNGQFYLVTRESVRANLDSTSISWNEIAGAFEGAKSRIIVFLDACQSGAAGGANDDAVAALLHRGAGITVVAASKGRQLAREINDGGFFTTALIRAITTLRSSTDTNRNGTIELSELYGVMKREVLAITKGKQTPWIARNLMVGEIPLF